jgi:hypothetical protein
MDIDSAHKLVSNPMQSDLKKAKAIYAESPLTIDCDATPDIACTPLSHNHMTPCVVVMKKSAITSGDKPICDSMQLEHPIKAPASNPLVVNAESNKLTKGPVSSTKLATTKMMPAIDKDEEEKPRRSTDIDVTKPKERPPMPQKQSSKSLFDNLSIGPQMFVNLKKGDIRNFYNVGKIIGQGAYGTVSVVTHKTTDIQRAMKTLKKNQVLKEKEMELFNEVSILKTLDHPNIIKLFELYQDESHYYLITESAISTMGVLQLS